MKALLRIGLAAVAVLGVSGCRGLLPHIPADDLFGIDGADVDLTAAALAVTALALPPQTSFSGTFGGSIDSDGIDLPGLVIGLTASALEESVLVASTAIVAAEVADQEALPQTFTFTSGSIWLAVFDGGAQLGTATGTAAFTPGITFSQVECDAIDTEVACTYSATIDSQVHAIVASASGTSAQNVFNAIEQGGTFTVEGVFEVTLAEPGLTASAAVTVTLDTFDGQIVF